MIRFVIAPFELKSPNLSRFGKDNRAHYAVLGEHRRHHETGRERTREALALAGVHPSTLLPVEVRIIRVSFGHVDDDAVVAAAKWLRDGIAEALGVNDGGPFIRFRYGQKKGPRKMKAVIVRLEKRAPRAAP